MHRIFHIVGESTDDALVGKRNNSNIMYEQNIRKSELTSSVSSSSQLCFFSYSIVHFRILDRGFFFLLVKFSVCFFFMDGMHIVVMTVYRIHGLF